MIKTGVLSLFAGLLAMGAMAQSAPEPEAVADECPRPSAKILYQAKLQIGTETTAGQVFNMAERAREICLRKSSTMAVAAQIYFDFAKGANDTEQYFQLLSKAYEAVHETTIATDLDATWATDFLYNLDGPSFQIITEDHAKAMRTELVHTFARMAIDGTYVHEIFQDGDLTCPSIRVSM